MGDAFYVIEPSDGFVYDLQEKVKKKKQNTLAHVDADMLNLWRLRNPRTVEEVERTEYLANLIRLDNVPNNGHEGGGDLEAAWLMKPTTDRISLHFPELPLPPENKIRVLVQAPAPAIGECFIHLAPARHL